MNQQSFVDHNDIPIACDLTALSAEERVRYDAIRRQLGEAVQRVRDLPDGYAYRYAADTTMVLAEFIAFERRCCPFLRFTLTIEPGADAVELALTGRPGVKEFVAEEMGAA